MAHLLYFKTSYTFHIVVIVDFRKMHCSIIDYPKTLFKCVGFHFITCGGGWAGTFMHVAKPCIASFSQMKEEEWWRRYPWWVLVSKAKALTEHPSVQPRNRRQVSGTETEEKQVPPFFYTLVVSKLNRGSLETGTWQRHPLQEAKQSTHLHKQVMVPTRQAGSKPGCSTDCAGRGQVASLPKL